jgi:hypothetical protein
VVHAHALVVAQAHRHRLVPAVHGHQVDVHVDDQIALDGAAVDVDRLALGGLAQVNDAVGILGVVVVVAVGVEGVEDLLAHHALHLALGHAPVQRVGDDEMDVVHAVGVELFEQNLDNGLPDVRRAHGRQRQADVVDGDGHAHARRQLRVQRIRVERMVEA